ncbi:MAG: dihydroorotase [Chitinophagales bacterium]|nr:dihydroorotase [Chitinophagales bacterium]MCZ2394014.1 dihydroorotase [Chitinophagales bacterium]
MKSYLLKGGAIVNEGKIFHSDILIENSFISKIDKNISHPTAEEIKLDGLYILPGVIDDQVHFREPGYTHKANIATEAAAAVAGGTTSFMEMPNTNPPALTQELLQNKYNIASQASLANYSFFMGTSNDNLEEVLKTNPQNVCGVKIFMGSSTGNMLVDNEKTLRNLFSKVELLIAAHCEDEKTVKDNLAEALKQYGENIPANQHPIIRSDIGCYKSTSLAFDLAREYNTRFHVLHISTAIETALMSKEKLSKNKRITSEVCVHHLYFSEKDYAQLGHLIKCNPAIKFESDREAIWEALLDDRLDIIATDHAPHQWDEKQQVYTKAPSGLPLVQHSLVMMLNFVKQGKISLEKVVEKMSHAPAVCFNIEKRGFIREGFKADLAIVDLNNDWKVQKNNILYKCGWSPLEGKTMHSKVIHTFVSGQLAMYNGQLQTSVRGERLTFERN